jgi:hypothetical protein
MALAGAPASPAPVTAPVTPPAPASAPAGPPSTGGTQVAQGPSQTATDAVPPPQQVLAQSQTLLRQDQARAQVGALSREEAQRKAAAFVQLGLQYERAGVKIADNLKPFVEFYLDQAKPTQNQRDAEYVHPGDPKLQRQRVDRAMGDNRPAAVQEYHSYRQQEIDEGRKPLSEGEWDLRRRRSHNDPLKQEGEEEKLRIKSASDFLETVAKGAPKIAQRNADLDLLTRIIAKTPTGRTANLRAWLDSFGKELGLSPGTLATQQAAIEAVSQRVTSTMREPGIGSQSDYELRALLGSVPHMIATPGANQIIAASLKRAADLDKQRASIAARWQAGKLRLSDARTQIADLDDKSIYASPQEKQLIENLMGGAPQSGGATEQNGWGDILKVEP